MWHVGDNMQVVMMDFKNWCGMLNIMGAIDVIHVSIAKPYGFFYEDYYYHKVGNYNIVVKIMVDNQKKIYECVCMKFFWECENFSNVEEVCVVLLCIT
jgi:hypothetical protein